MNDIISMIKAEVASLGFSFAGFAKAKQPPHFRNYEIWLAKNHHGEMHYLAEPYVKHARENPLILLEQAKSVIVFGLFYSPSRQKLFNKLQQKTTVGLIAAYAQYNDYHKILKDNATLLMSNIKKKIGRDVKYKIFVDSGTLMEKDFSYMAGLGWIGRNSLLITPDYGSFCFIGCILTDLELPTQEPLTRDLCGDCMKCIQACPTQCIQTNHSIDARKCIAYLTIEHKGIIPREYRALIGNRIFGCDICQNVCPLNANKEPLSSSTPQGFNRMIAGEVDLVKEIQLNPKKYQKKYEKTPIIRVTYENYRRNLIITMGNSRNSRCIEPLKIILIWK